MQTWLRLRRIRLRIREKDVLELTSWSWAVVAWLDDMGLLGEKRGALGSSWAWQYDVCVFIFGSFNDEIEDEGKQFQNV